MDKEYLIKKWLNDDLKDAERIAFEELDDHRLHNDIVEGAQYFKASHFSKVSAFDELEGRSTKAIQVKKLNWIKPLMRIASVLVIGLGVYFFFFFNSLTHIETLASEKITTELPDGSSIILNALTTISYNKSKWDSNREIQLDGEAYFKVAKGKVFDVVTDNGVVSVLGTQFNIKQRDNYFEVMCYEGIVRVATNDTVKKLLAGDTFRMNNDILSFSDTKYAHSQWTKNVSTFKSVPFEQVIDELERQYGILIIDESKKSNRLFTGGFVQDDLENALNSISEPLGLNYKIESSNQVRILGSEK